MIHRCLFALVACLIGVPVAFAQIDPLNPVPGGATGRTAVCIQVGELNSGAFTGLFAATGRELWEGYANARPGSERFEELRRTEAVIEIWRGASGTLYEFDFGRKKVRSGRKKTGEDLADAFHMLNAADRDGAADCMALAGRLAGKTNLATGPLAEDVSKAAGPLTLIQHISIRPGTVFVVPPGTTMTATSGPPCPGQPGFFLCPNKFSCAPVGGVCCPGAGACAPGSYCDKFVANACIGPASPRFCPGTGDPLTGVSLHCAVGSACMPGNICVP